LLIGTGCAPAPVTARAPADKTMGAGGPDVRIVVRDGAVVGADAAGAGRGGAGGTAARPAIDAGPVIDGSSAEMPKLSRRDAGAGQASDMAADGVWSDAAADRPIARSPRPGEIVIDEILVNPTGDDLGREWVELTNLAAEPLDLSQLHLATASTDVAVMAGTIAAGALLLLGQSSDPSKNGGAPVAVAYGTKLILVNASGQLSLCLGVCATGLVVDAITWPTLDEGYTGHALVIDPASKAVCPAGTPFGTGGSFGTPGAPNPSCTQNIDAGSQRDVSVAD
jgi:hypothetical protein